MVRRRDRWVRMVGAVVALGLVAGACGDDDDESPTSDPGATPTTAAAGVGSARAGDSVDGELKFGAVMPLTGDLAQYGPGMLGAVELAIADINAAGGVNGRPVALVSDDDATNPDVANTVAERFIGSERVDGIIGAAGSNVTLLGVIAPTVGAGRLECSGSATAAALSLFRDDGLFFRTAPSDVFQSQLLADTIAAEGYSSVAIVNRADEYGQGFADATADALEDAGAEIAVEVAVDPTATNVDADVERVVSADPDAVVLIMFPEEGARFLAAMVEAGIGPDALPTFVTDGLASDDLGAAVDPGNPAIVNGIRGTRPGSSEESPEAAQFAERLGRERGAATTTFAPQFYDCTVLLALGSVAAGTDDPRAVADEIVELSRDGEPCGSFAECLPLVTAGEDVDYQGLTAFDFNDDGEPDRGAYELWQFDGAAITVLSTSVVESE